MIASQEIAAAAQLACLLEASAPKPGNVSPGIGFHDMRYEDIARVLRCEVGTVKVRVYRALKELREHFCELRGEKLYDV